MRSISNLVKLMSEYFNFKLVAFNRDFKCDKPYTDVNTNKWNHLDNNEVFYTDHSVSIRKVINDKNFDLYYLNSFFSYNFSIKIVLLRRLRLIPYKKVILAPRGELGTGALSLKGAKKRFFIFISKLFRLHKDVVWQASTEKEAEYIKKIFGSNINIEIALDVPEVKLLQADLKNKSIKEKGKLKILFLSVIHKGKNLKYIIDVLSKVKGDFTLDIYGPVKDEKYWLECSSLINKTNKENIFYKGIAEHNKITEIYPKYDLFFLPTLGENFGHVIFESLALGCPVLTTNNVIWTNLEENRAGWNFDVKETGKFVMLLEKLINCDLNEYETLTNNFRGYIRSRINENNLIESNKKLFEEVV